MTFDLIFAFDFKAIIDLNWWRTISLVSGRYLQKGLMDCSHIAHAHALGVVDVPFGGYDIWPNFWPVSLRRFIDFYSVSGRYLGKCLLDSCHIVYTHVCLEGCGCDFLGAMTIVLISNLRLWGRYWLELMAEDIVSVHALVKLCYTSVNEISINITVVEISFPRVISGYWIYSGRNLPLWVIRLRRLTFKLCIICQWNVKHLKKNCL